jgi:hypothetical protein
VAHDLLGHYGTAFLVAGILAIAAAGLSLRIARAPAPTQIEVATA